MLSSAVNTGVLDTVIGDYNFKITRIAGGIS